MLIEINGKLTIGKLISSLIDILHIPLCVERHSWPNTKRPGPGCSTCS